MALDPDDRTLYIGNLDKNVTEDVLFELFLQAGPIERVNIVGNRINSYCYGFVTYKHEVSIDYAIKLFKGTFLFNKMLYIKKKGTNNNSDQSNDYGKHGSVELVKTHNKHNLDLGQYAQDQLHNGLQNSRFNSSCDSQMIFNFKTNSMDESRSIRNKPYNHKPRKYSSRPKHQRSRHDGRNDSNISYHNRKRY